MNQDPSEETRHREVSIAWSLLGATATTAISFCLLWKLHFSRDAQAGISLLFMILYLPVLFPLGLSFAWPPLEWIRLLWNRRNGFLAKRELFLYSLLPCLVLGIAIAIVAPYAHRQHLYSTAHSEKTDTARIAQLYNRALDLHDQGLLRAIAGNRNTPVEILVDLSNDEYADIRCNVACNPSTPLETLQRLAHDQNKPVREIARKHPRMQ